MRPNKHQYYLSIAEAVLARSTCLRRRYGAVIVKDDEIIATGYNGSPRGWTNCCDRGTCQREELQVPHGERFELCSAIHAEENAIISAPRRDLIGSVLYLAGQGADGNPVIDAEPCLMCRRLLINAGIDRVISKSADGGLHVITVKNLKE